MEKKIIAVGRRSTVAPLKGPARGTKALEKMGHPMHALYYK